MFKCIDEFTIPICQTGQTHSLHRRLIKINGLEEHCTLYNRMSLIVYRINGSIETHVSVKNCMSSVCVCKTFTIIGHNNRENKIMDLFLRKLVWCTLIKGQILFAQLQIFNFSAKKATRIFKTTIENPFFFMGSDNICSFIFRFGHFRQKKGD